MKNKVIFISKIAALFVFATVFALNLSTVLTDKEGALSVKALTAYAATSSSSSPPKYTCQGHDCTIVYNVGAVQVSVTGQYFNCVTSTTGSCESSSCDKDCTMEDLEWRG